MPDVNIWKSLIVFRNSSVICKWYASDIHQIRGNFYMLTLHEIRIYFFFIHSEYRVFTLATKFVTDMSTEVA